MGIYLNPDNESFQKSIRSKIYIDKTGMIEKLNDVISTEQNCFCISRPRRFGKSVTASMLEAYYSKGADSDFIFKNYAISTTDAYNKHLNHYNVIHFDVSSFLSVCDDVSHVVKLINDAILEELQEEFTDILDDKIVNIFKAISIIYTITRQKFVIIIDEWDCIIREEKNNNVLIDEYLNFLRTLFKSDESRRFLALGYITGILPIKKFDGESALNNFYEFTMTDPGEFAEYIGFTEDEVERLCQQYNIDIETIREWYDGYCFENCEHIYNPNSLVQAILRKKVNYYWKNTASYESLNEYIGINYKGLKEDIISLISGNKIKIDITTFKNDLINFSSKDDILTALVHLGYLAFDEQSNYVSIPNEEVRIAFISAIKVGGWHDVRIALEQSEELLQATITSNAEFVEQAIANSQMQYSSIIEYNDENALACAIMMAYYTAREYYTIVREIPAGKGFADIAFIPKSLSDKPAMLFELKWNQSAISAINQIKSKSYTGVLSNYYDDLLMIGINYDKSTKKHNCMIEKYKK